MYYYIYDSVLGDKKYAPAIERIENRLTDLGIGGKIHRLSFLKNIHQVLVEEIKRGVKTMVVVGDDKTLSQMINTSIDLNLTIGYIPIEPTPISKLFNIPAGEAACDILSGRIVKKLDLGKVNDYYFLTSLEMIGQNIDLEFNGDYFISLKEKDSIVNISNLNNCYNIISYPDDNRLDVFIENTEKKMWKKVKSYLSHLQITNLKVTCSSPLPVLITDEKRVIKAPLNITVATEKIRMITGKGKHF